MTVKVKAASTLGLPRTFAFAKPPGFFTQLKTSSMRLRIRWLRAYPAWRSVRPSIAVLRVLPRLETVPLTAMWGVTSRLRRSPKKPVTS
jgi:hypothetical protein